MTRGLIALGVLIVIGLLKLPVERDLAALHRQEHFRGVEFNLDLREKLGQLGFMAALSGINGRKPHNNRPKLREETALGSQQPEFSFCSRLDYTTFDLTPKSTFGAPPKGARIPVVIRLATCDNRITSRPRGRLSVPTESGTHWPDIPTYRSKLAGLSVLRYE